jgi:hypothetical protein
MIKVDVLKARSIAHDIRRAEREKEFSPLDTIIAKQIPGKSLETAEEQRQKIRDKYAVIQTNIDRAESVDELRAVVSSFIK